MSFGPVAAYLVDVLHSRSAESLAVNRFVCLFLFFFFADWKFELTLLASAFRSVIVALAVAATLPMIDTYGILLTNVLCAVLVWISFVYVVVLKNKIKIKNKKIADDDIFWIVGYVISSSMVNGWGCGLTLDFRLPKITEREQYLFFTIEECRRQYLEYRESVSFFYVHRQMTRCKYSAESTVFSFEIFTVRNW